MLYSAVCGEDTQDKPARNLNTVTALGNSHYFSIIEVRDSDTQMILFLQSIVLHWEATLLKIFLELATSSGQTKKNLQLQHECHQEQVYP